MCGCPVKLPPPDRFSRQCALRRAGASFLSIRACHYQIFSSHINQSYQLEKLRVRRQRQYRSCLHVDVRLLRLQSCSPQVSTTCLNPTQKSIAPPVLTTIASVFIFLPSTINETLTGPATFSFCFYCSQCITR